MAKCAITVCNERASWEGTLAALNGEHSREVVYCDDHAWSQIQSVPSTLSLHLKPIGQRSKS